MEATKFCVVTVGGFSATRADAAKVLARFGHCTADNKDFSKWEINATAEQLTRLRQQWYEYMVFDPAVL